MALEEWNRLVTAPVADLLAPRGFRKAGLTFTARRSEVTLLVNLQSSAGSAQEALKITCNLGILVNRLVERPGSTVWDAHWRMRIGFLLSEPRDHWWNCSSNEDAQHAGKEIAALLGTRGLPEMERLATLAALAALWSSGRSPGLTDQQRLTYLAQLQAGDESST